MSGEVPEIPLPDGTPGGLINWMLAGLCMIVGFLWKLNEGKNGKAIVDIQQRLTESEKQHKTCLEDRYGLATQLAVNSERLNQLEKKFVQGVDQ